MITIFNYFKIRIKLLFAFIKYSIQIETAYFFNNWSNLISTIAFTVTYVIFIDVIFSNTKNLAGYSKDEMLLFTLISQTWFYMIFNLSLPNIENLIERVNSGNLDTLLTKPLPVSFFINFGELKIMQGLRDGSIPLFFIIYSIDWSNLKIDSADLVLGLGVFLLGTMITNVILFLAALPVFWLGESSSILGTVLEIEYNVGHTLPLEAYSKNLRTIFISVMPFAISTCLSTAVILNRFDASLALLISALALATVMIIRIFLWNIALKNYTSASS